MLERNPTLKAEMAEIENPEDGATQGKSVPVAFYTYPVMQVANILMPRAHLVPVGEDQLPHIEMTREVARRFNRRFKAVFPEPEGLVGRVARLVGTDGQAKMSKSKNNAIHLKDDAETVTRKVMSMWTPRMSPTEPGDPDATPAFMYHRAFNADAEEVADLEERYRKGAVGDVEVKRKLAAALNEFLEPIRDRRAHFEGNMGMVREALEHGTRRGRVIAQETMAMVRDALDLNYLEQHR
jgi:tryptophanyl-tRNA synthetase